jgi:LysR family hydrogen peroxide-inducible transcriptional activator
MLRLGVIYTIGPYLLPHLIPAACTAARLTCRCRSKKTTRRCLSERLKDGELDVLILSLAVRRAGNLHKIGLRSNPSSCWCRPATPWSKAIMGRCAETLARQDLLLLGPRSLLSGSGSALLPGLQPLEYVGSDNMQRTLEGSSLETIRLMVATGMGITVLPYTSVSGYAQVSDLLSVRPFSDPRPTRIVALAWRKSFPRHRVIDLLTEAIRACPLGEAIHLLE